MPINPYSSLYPVERFELLYGRQELMWELNSLLSDSSVSRVPCISLVGLTRSGKTSVLNALASVDRLHHDLTGSRPVKDVLFVRVDCSGLPEETPASFWRFITFQLIKTSGNKWPSFAFKPHQFSGATDFEICHWNLQQLAQQKLLVAFLFDEFDRVTAGLPSEVAGNLRFLLDDLPGHIMYVTATPRPLGSYLSLTEKPRTGSGIMTYFKETHYVSLLEDKQPNGIYDFIRLPALANGVRFTDDDVYFALATGARHPDLTRQTCKRLFEARVRQPQGSLAYDLFKKAAYADFETFYGHFWPALPTEQQDALIYFATGDPSRSSISEVAVSELRSLGLLESFARGYRLFSPYLADVVRSHHQPKLTHYKPVSQSNRQVAQAPIHSQPPFVAAPLFVPQPARNKKFLVAVYTVLVLGFALCTLGIIDWASGGVVSNEISSLGTTHAFMQSAIVALVILLELALIVGIMWRSLGTWEKRWKRKMEKTPASPAEGAMIAKNSKDTAIEFAVGVAASALAGIISTVVAAILLHLLHQ